MTSALDEMMEGDASSRPAPSDSQLEGVAALVREQIELEAAVEQCEKLLSDAKKELRRVSEVKLPEAMQALGIESFSTSDGYAVMIKNDIFASIKNANKAAAFTWLRERGFEDIIKNEVTVSFGRGDDALVAQLGDYLSDHAMNNWKQKESVHSGTLKAFIKEQLSMGAEVPLDLFGAYVFNKSIVKEP